MGNGSEAFNEFPLTRWSLVDRAAEKGSDEGFTALGELLERYRPALKAHLVFVKRIPPYLADDYVQSFITGKFLEGDLVSRADKQKGRFRTFLLTSFDRFIASEIRKAQAQKRSPGEGNLAHLDDVEPFLSEEASQEKAYDKTWAHQVILAAVERTQAELTGSDRAAYWSMFDIRVVQPILNGIAPPPYEELVGQLGFDSPSKASNALLTAKRIFARKLQEVVGEYVETEDEIDDELRELQAIVSA